MGLRSEIYISLRTPGANGESIAMKENACSTQAAGFPAVLRVQTNAQKRHFCRADTNNLLLLRSSALGSGMLGFFRSCAREVLTRTLIGVDLLEILLGIPVQHTNLKPMSCCSKKPKGNVTPKPSRLEPQLGFQCCRSAAPDALLARDPKQFNIGSCIEKQIDNRKGASWSRLAWLVLLWPKTSACGGLQKLWKRNCQTLPMTDPAT